MMNKFYINTRRFARKLVINNQFLDKYFGDFLRKFEKKYINLHKVLEVKEDASISVSGYSLYYRPVDMGVVSTLLLHNSYEPETTSELEGILEPGMTFLDIGANIGYFTLVASKLVGPAGRVISFEPIKSTYDILRKNVEENCLNNTIIENLAVGEKASDVIFSCPKDNPESAKIAEADSNPVNTVTVKSESLDNYLEAGSFGKVDVIKMDIEGAELKALIGMRNTLTQADQIFIFFEYNFENFKNMNIEPKMIFDVMLEAGITRFYTLWREKKEICVPDDYGLIKALSKKYTFNILAHK